MKWQSSSRLRGVLNKAKGELEVGIDFLKLPEGHVIPLENGILRLEDMQLIPYSPDFGIRSQLPVKYISDAKCPKFLSFLNKALSPEDVEVLQLWFGMALYGKNKCHKILILTGVAGAGKGTIARIITEILGRENVQGLRTKLLESSFETARFIDKKLLYGADVPLDFLSVKSASILKALVGDDLIATERKNANENRAIIGDFNILITCNGKLYVHLESDADAWRRRLIIIEFKTIPLPQDYVADLSGVILEEERSGILNWMIEGAVKLLKLKWQFPLHQTHTQIIDEHLSASSSPKFFIQEKTEVCIEGNGITARQLHEAYSTYCHAKQWTPFLFRLFVPMAEKEIGNKFRLPSRHDIPDDKGKDQQGWKGIRLK